MSQPQSTCRHNKKVADVFHYKEKGNACGELIRGISGCIGESNDIAKNRLNLNLNDKTVLWKSLNLYPEFSYLAGSICYIPRKFLLLLLESLAATLPSESEQQAPAAARSLFPPPQSATPAPVAAPVFSAMPVAAPAQPVPVESPIAVSATQPAMPTPNTARGALFRSRVSEPVSLSKETLLKPLLEKIALCH